MKKNFFVDLCCFIFFAGPLVNEKLDEMVTQLISISKNGRTHISFFLNVMKIILIKIAHFLCSTIKGINLSYWESKFTLHLLTKQSFKIKFFDGDSKISDTYKNLEFQPETSNHRK